MFLIEDKKGNEFDRWSTKELAVQCAQGLLKEDPKLKRLDIIEADQATGKRVRVQTVR